VGKYKKREPPVGNPPKILRRQNYGKNKEGGFFFAKKEAPFKWDPKELR